MFYGIQTKLFQNLVIIPASAELKAEIRSRERLRALGRGRSGGVVGVSAMKFTKKKYANHCLFHRTKEINQRELMCLKLKR